jgi:hypothetical protein
MGKEKLLKTCFWGFSRSISKKQLIGVSFLDFLPKEADLEIMRKLNLAKKRWILIWMISLSCKSMLRKIMNPNYLDFKEIRRHILIKKLILFLKLERESLMSLSHNHLNQWKEKKFNLQLQWNFSKWWRKKEEKNKKT